MILTTHHLGGGQGGPVTLTLPYAAKAVSVTGAGGETLLSIVHDPGIEQTAVAQTFIVSAPDSANGAIDVGAVGRHIGTCVLNDGKLRHVFEAVVTEEL